MKKNKATVPEFFTTTNQGLFIKKDMKNPIAEGSSHEFNGAKSSAVGGSPRPHPPIKIDELGS